MEVIFEGCVDLTEVSLPNTIVEIKEYTFAKSGLTKINIPDNVIFICDNAFWNFVNLSEVVLQSNTAKISVSTFVVCNSLVKNNYT